MSLNTHFTTIIHPVRKLLSITALEYCFIDTVMKLANNPESKKPGWCYAKKQDLANDFGITRPGLYKMIDRLVELDLIERDPKGDLRHTSKWYQSAVLNKDSIISDSDVNKVDTVENVNLVYRARKLSLQKNVNKVDTECKQSLQHELRSNTESNNELNVELLSPVFAENNNPEPAKAKEKITPKIPAAPPKKEKPKSAADYSEQIREIVAYLNERSKSRYSDSSKGTVKLCNGRLSGGFSIDDFKLIIDHKCSQWLNDAKMSEYLRPETLFCEKHFEGYLNAAIRWNADGRKVVLNGAKGPITAAAETRSNNVKQNQHDVLSTIIANRKY